MGPDLVDVVGDPSGIESIVEDSPIRIYILVRIVRRVRIPVVGLGAAQIELAGIGLPNGVDKTADDVLAKLQFVSENSLRGWEVWAVGENNGRINGDDLRIRALGNPIIE